MSPIIKQKLEKASVFLRIGYVYTDKQAQAILKKALVQYDFI